MNDDELRLDRLESQLAIQRLVADYCHGVDLHDEARFLAIWHPDAVWAIGGPWGDFHGEHQIGVALRDLIWAGLPETHHWTTNLVVDIDGDDATGLSNADCNATDLDGRALRITATYRDRYERRSETWKIARREIDLHVFWPVDRSWGVDLETRFSPPAIEFDRSTL